jgi:CheY-like chemotaxis protein
MRSAAGEGREQMTTSNHRSRKVLIVDDDRTMLALLRFAFQRAGWEVITAGNGAQALALAVQDIPDAILLDIMMPEMDGYQVATRLRNVEPLAHIPIVAYTAISPASARMMALQVGMNGVLPKLTPPHELIARLKTFLSPRPMDG